MMENSENHSMKFASVIHSIPANLTHRIQKEIKHTLETNLCVYQNHYVSHTTVHFTSAETQFLSQAVDAVRKEMAGLGWFIEVLQSDPSFIEVYIADTEMLLRPLVRRAFVEAAGLDDTDLAAMGEEISYDDVPEMPLHDAHVLGMFRLSYSEKIEILLNHRFKGRLTAQTIRTSLLGPHVRVALETGETFVLYPQIEDLTDEPKILFGYLMEGPHEIDPEAELISGFSQLLQAVERKLNPIINENYKLFQTFKQNVELTIRYDLRFEDGRIELIDLADPTSKAVLNHKDGSGLFELEMVVAGVPQGTFMATVDDILSMLLR